MAAANNSRKRRASELVRYEWANRIEAEYQSAAITQELVLWLIQIGASPDLIRAGNRIVDDELVHASMAQKVWAAAGGEIPRVMDRSKLSLRREHAALELDVVASLVSVFCLGETVAVRLFSHLRRRATVPVARRALDRILRDEVRHRDFGWIALEWLLERPGAGELRGVIEKTLPAWIADLEKNYGDDLDGGIESVTVDERSWGIAPWREYAAILHRAYEHDYRSRFAKLGIEFGPGKARTGEEPRSTRV